MRINLPQRRPLWVKFLAVALAVTAPMGTINGAKPSVLAVAPAPTSSDRWTYADVADLFLTSPIVLTARVTQAIPVKDAVVPPPRAGTMRVYIVADVVTVIRGSGGVVPQVSWLVDVPLDGRGKLPKLKATQVLIAALPVAGRPDELTLAARDAMLAWDAPLEARVHETIASSLAVDAPPQITGIASAFHSAGNLQGEGETQVFLATADKRPVSLSILRRPGQEPRWALALGEIVDEAAKPPARDSLGWYRLACFLPRTLPDAAGSELSAEDAAAARVDYAFVIASLGACTRTRG